MLRKHKRRMLPSPIVSQMIFDFVRAYKREHTYPPTLREIATHCNISLGSVSKHLEELEKQGKLYREIGKARGLIIVEEMEGDEQEEK